MKWIKVILNTLLIMVLAWGSLIWAVYTLFHSRDHVQDKVLIRNLQTDSRKYAQLISMFRADHPLSVVHPSWIQPENVITAQRWEEYKALFNELGLDGGMRAWGGESIKFLSTTQGFVTGGSVKGYIYKPEYPRPLYSNLDSIPEDLPSNVTGYRRINDDWYIIFDWDD